MVFIIEVDLISVFQFSLSTTEHCIKAKWEMTVDFLDFD